MSKKNKNFRRKNNKKKELTNLSIKVGDWFKVNDLSSKKSTTSCLYCVQYIDKEFVKFTAINLEVGSINTSTWDREHFEQSGDDIRYIRYTSPSITHTNFTRISKEEVYRTITDPSWPISCILDCFRDLPPQPSSKQKKENNLSISKNCDQLWKRFKDLEGKYIELFYGGYGIQYLKVNKVDYDSENNKFHISGFGPYLRRGIIHNSWDWTNYVCEKEGVLPEDLLQAQEISKEEFKKAEEKLREKLSHEKTVRNFLEKDKKPLTDLVGKYLKFTRDWATFGTMYFHLKDIQIETYGDYQCCKIQYENDRFSVNKKGKITYLTGENIQDTIPFESFKDAVIITEEEFNKAKSREGFKKQEKPIKIYTKEELKSSILKYTSPDGSIYYLEHPEIPKVGIENKTGKFKNCVVSYGIMISNGGQVHLYTPKINPFNPIVLLIESESDEGFFSRVEKISDHEWDSLKKSYLDKIVKI